MVEFVCLFVFLKHSFEMGLLYLVESMVRHDVWGITFPKRSQMPCYFGFLHI